MRSCSLAKRRNEVVRERVSVTEIIRTALGCCEDGKHLPPVACAEGGVCLSLTNTTINAVALPLRF